MTHQMPPVQQQRPACRLLGIRAAMAMQWMMQFPSADGGMLRRLPHPPDAASPEAAPCRQAPGALSGHGHACRTHTHLRLPQPTAQTLQAGKQHQQ
jgi:hypothetical protein